MASKRHLRRKACVGKIRHETMEQARAMAWNGTIPYHCPFCGGYHVGHCPGYKNRFKKPNGRRY